MELKDARCTNCGAHLNLEPQKTMAKCEYCHSTIMVANAVKLALVEVDKTKDLERYRSLLKDAIQKNSIGEILTQARQIKDIIPSDFTANYYFAYAKQARNEPSFMKAFLTSDLPATPKETKDVVNHIIHRSDLRDKPAIIKFLTRFSPDSTQRYEDAHTNRARQENQYADIPRDIFICHSSHDHDLADYVVKTLEDDGYSCWISSRNLRPEDNDNYWINIENAIKKCRVFIVISSESAMLSKDVQYEIQKASEYQIPYFEIKIDHKKHTSFFDYHFKGIKWIDASNDIFQKSEVIKKRVFTIIKNPTEVPEPNVESSSIKITGKSNKKYLIWPALFLMIVTMVLSVFVLTRSNEVIVTFTNLEGNEFIQETYQLGESINYPEAPKVDGYNFIRWDPVVRDLDDDVTLSPIYEPISYTVSLIDLNDEIIETFIVKYGDSLTLPDHEREGLTFMGWSETPSVVTGHMDIYAQYENLNVDIAFENYVGEIILETTIPYGGNATPPIIEQEGYDFIGWSSPLNGVVRDTVFEPLFERKTYQVSFVDDAGNIISTVTVNHGENASLPTPPPKENLEFDTWVGEVNNITSDRFITAQYKQITDAIETTEYLDGEFRIYEHGRFTFRVPVEATVDINRLPQETGQTVTSWPVVELAGQLFSGWMHESSIVPNGYNITDQESIDLEAVFIPLGFDYQVQGNSIHITGYDRETQVIDIPAYILNRPVESVVFDNANSPIRYDFVTTIILPKTLKVIGNLAFQNFYSLTELQIPEDSQLQTIESSSFQNVRLMNELYIPASVVSLPNTFGLMIGLETITVEEENDSYRSIDGVLFSEDLSILHLYPSNKKARSYMIPEGVEKTLLYGGFSSNSYLEELTIPASFETFESGSFSGLSNLTNIRVDEDNPYYSSIEGVLFNKNKNELIKYPSKKIQNSFELPDLVEVIKESAFDSAQFLSELQINETSRLRVIEDFSFLGTINLDSLYIPLGVEQLGDRLFIDSGIESFNVSLENEFYSSNEEGLLLSKDQTRLIVFPSGLSLNAFYFPDYIEIIEEDALAFSHIQNVYFNESSRLKEIKRSAFLAGQLRSLDLPPSLETIYESAFAGNSNLESITLNRSRVINGSITRISTNSVGNQSGIIEDNLSSEFKILVPSDSLNEYINNYYWEPYSEYIKPID